MTLQAKFQHYKWQLNSKFNTKILIVSILVFVLSKLYLNYEVCIEKTYLNNFEEMLVIEYHRTFKIKKRENFFSKLKWLYTEDSSLPTRKKKKEKSKILLLFRQKTIRYRMLPFSAFAVSLKQNSISNRRCICVPISEYKIA